MACGMYANKEDISTLTWNEYIIRKEAHKSVVFIRRDLRPSLGGGLSVYRWETYWNEGKTRERNGDRGHRELVRKYG